MNSKRQNSLPQAQTTFIGRESERAMLQRLLAPDGARFVTLTGPPGVGKTRLAVEAVREMVAAFGSSVWFVDLSPLADDAQVLPAIAQVLGMDVADPAYQITALAGAITQPTLLLLDNFEQVLPAAADLHALIGACSMLHLLVTSRVPLNLQHEQVLQVPPMPVPDVRQLLPLPELATLPSVRLFVERAQARRAHFALTEANAALVAALCVALDGLPLALELAAAQTNRMALPALVAWVQQHQPLPPWSAADLPARQQTIQTAIQWSYDLLTSAEQALFRRLAVLVNDWTVEAALAIAAPDMAGGRLLATLATLVDASLILPTPSATDAPRFRMLHVIRAFALAQLADDDQRVSIERRHGAYFLDLAEQAHDAALSPERLVGLPLLERLTAEQDDVRAALEHSLDQADAVETTLRFVAALAPVWMLGGRLHEGRDWLARVAQHAQAHATSSALLSVLSWAATFAYHQGDLRAAEQYQTHVLTSSDQIGDRRAQASALLGLALIADARGAYDQALALNEQSRVIYDELDDASGQAWALTNRSYVLLAQTDYDQAEALLHESLRLFMELHDLRGRAWVRIGFGHIAFAQSDIAQATRQYALSSDLFAQLGDVRGTAWARTNMGRTLRVVGDLDGASALHAQSLTDYQRVGDQRGIARALLHQAETLIACVDNKRALVALVECQRIFREIGDAPGESRARTLRQSLTHVPVSSPHPNAPRLTPREHEVLHLVADGLTNKAIATRLAIAPGTVSLHLESIYRKLGVSSRVTALHVARRWLLLPNTA